MRPHDDAVHQQFTAALDGLIEHVKSDRSILAAVLCGSLSHDTVWAKSDIDLVFVTIDDRLITASDVALNADGVNIHAHLMPRAAFRRVVEGSSRNSFMHSLLAKGRLLYSHDPTIDALCGSLAEIGGRDTELQLLRAFSWVLPAIDKAHKWFVTRGDLDYTALWILYCANGLARIEVIGRRLLADREVILQALQLNPPLFKTIYTDLLNARKTRASVLAALDAVDKYVLDRAPALCRPIIDHLRETGDVRSCSELEAHFSRTADLNGVTTVCEYLANQGLIGKAAAPAHLTRRSHVDVQELAFYYLGDPVDGQGR